MARAWKRTGRVRGRSRAAENIMLQILRKAPEVRGTQMGE